MKKEESKVIAQKFQKIPNGTLALKHCRAGGTGTTLFGEQFRAVTAGKGVMEAYETFPGIEVSFNVFLASEIKFQHDASDSVLEIYYCRSGRVGWNMQDGTAVYLGTGDVTAHSMACCADSAMMFPLGYSADRSEASACISAALHCALGRPEVSVRLKRDGEEVFFTPGDGREESAVYALLGRETARGMLPVSGKGENMAVMGFTSSPAFGRGNRANQHFYCNGRYIKSVLLQSAVEQAYKNTLLTGKFPSCVLYLELSRGAVDVNVHPA